MDALERRVGGLEVQVPQSQTIPNPSEPRNQTPDPEDVDRTKMPDPAGLQEETITIHMSHGGFIDRIEGIPEGIIVRALLGETVITWIDGEPDA